VEHRWRCSGERRVERQRAARPRVPINCARRQTVSRSQNGGAGPFLVNGPAPLRVPARHVSGARWGLPACGARGHRAGGIRRSWDQRGRWRPVRQRRRHRRGTPLGWEAHWVQLWSCPPVGAVPCRGGDTPPRFAAQIRRSERAGGGYFGVAGDPSTSRSGARTFRRITGHMTATQPSRVRG